jgi:hypothetical protein
LPEWASLMDGVYVARHADAADLADRIVEAAVGRRERTACTRKRQRIDLIDDLRNWTASGPRRETVPS